MDLPSQQPGTGMDLASPPRTPLPPQQLVHRTACQNAANVHSPQHVPDVTHLTDASMYHSECALWHVLWFTVTRPVVLWTITNTTFCVGQWFMSAIFAGVIQVLWNNKWVVAFTGGWYILQAGLPLIWGYLVLQANLPGVVTSTLLRETLFAYNVPTSTSTSGTWWCMTTFVCHLLVNCVSNAWSCWHIILQKAHNPTLVNAIMRVFAEKILIVVMLIVEAPLLYTVVKQQCVQLHQTIYTYRDVVTGQMPDVETLHAFYQQHQADWVARKMDKLKCIVSALPLLIVAWYSWQAQLPTTVDEWQQHCDIDGVFSTLKNMWLSDPNNSQCTNAAWHLVGLYPMQFATTIGIGNYSQTLDKSKADLLVADSIVTERSQWHFFDYLNVYDCVSSFACMVYHVARALYRTLERPAANTLVPFSQDYNS